MATFSENQVRQLYVAKALKGADTHLVKGDAVGTIEVFPGVTPTDHMYFEYMSNDSIVRSDLIDTASIKNVYRTEASKMQNNLKKVVVKVNPGVIEAKKDYFLKLVIRNYIGMSDADQKIKTGYVLATSAIAASPDLFYKAMAESLANNMARDYNSFFKVCVHSAATVSEKGFDDNGLLEVTGVSTVNYGGVVDVDSLVITEVEQPWTLGKFAKEPVNFNVLLIPYCSTTGEVDADWGTATITNDGGTVANGYLIADMEYFFKGERGDQYREVGFPNNFPYKGVADPTANYDMIDIEYSFSGDAEDVQKSPKVISIAINPTDAVTLLARIKAGAGIK